MARVPKPQGRGFDRQHPGDPKKTAESELPAIREYLRTKVPADAIVTATMISHLFDLTMDRPPKVNQAERAVELLIAEGYLIRLEENGYVPSRKIFLPKIKKG